MKTLAVSMLYLGKILWHPIDAYYDITYNKKGSVTASCLIYLLYFIVLIVQVMVTNFIFNPMGLHGTPVSQIFIVNVMPVFVLVIANCLVGSIKGGQGTYKAVFISTAYALAPVIIFIIPLALFSNVLTGAEEAIYQSLHRFIYIWMGFLMYIGIMEVHGYGIVEAVFNSIWIIFAAALLLLFAAAFFGITFQSASFLFEFIREAIGYV